MFKTHLHYLWWCKEWRRRLPLKKYYEEANAEKRGFMVMTKYSAHLTAFLFKHYYVIRVKGGFM